LALLNNFRESRTHFAVVLDEYGGVEGIVTLSDILEELVGDILPPGSEDAPEVVELGDGAWRIQGSIHVDDLVDELGLQDEVVPEGAGYQTLGGLLADRLGRVPQVGDETVWNGFRFVVEEMDGLRVDWVVVTRVVEEDASGE
ncbi:MAG: CBS domain-containing protein, partial [Trueperaceae bacterium]|nr:CBS domain-containing protein [Trueperaceae bacterium]